MQNYLYQQFPSERRFGVEIEVSNNLTKKQLGQAIKDYEIIYKTDNFPAKQVKITAGKEGWSQTSNNNYWHVKFDRTCGPKGQEFDSGWEIASFIGSGLHDVNHISRLARFLKTVGAETNFNCGLHIHVEVNDYNDDEMGRLVARWLKIEPILISICHPSRNKNRYCLPLWNLLNSYASIWEYNNSYIDSLSSQSIWNLLRPYDTGIHNNNSKKVTLNTVNFVRSQYSTKKDRNTIELRLPESLLDEVHVKNWIRLFVNFVESGKQKAHMPKNISSFNVSETLKCLGLSGEDQFLFLSDELRHTKKWFLEKILKTTYDRGIYDESKKLLELMTLN